MDLYLSSPIPSPPGSPQPYSYDEPLDAQWFDFIPLPTDEWFNSRPHILVLVPWFSENGLCIMAIPDRTEKQAIGETKENHKRNPEFGMLDL